MGGNEARLKKEKMLLSLWENARTQNKGQSHSRKHEEIEHSSITPFKPVFGFAEKL